MLQEQEPVKNTKTEGKQQNFTSLNSKIEKPLKESQLDFQKNYPKNIFIPMIQYLAQLGLKNSYQQCVGSRQEFQGKNVVSLGLIHKLMGAKWFQQNVERHVLISNISNKILMNSKIKKKLFHLYVVKNLFQVYDEDLKQFKKRISKLANSISQQSYIYDELFEYPSAILYLLRLFYNLISSNSQSQQFHSLKKQKQEQSPYKIEHQDPSNNEIERSQCPSQAQPQNDDKNSRQGSKEQFKYYIRKIIHHFNSELMNKSFAKRINFVQKQLMQRQKQLIQKYKLPINVPAWNIFFKKVVEKCFEGFKKSAKITHAMMNQWINHFKQHVTTLKCHHPLSNQRIIQPTQTHFNGQKPQKKSLPYEFSPYILQFYPK